MNAKYLIVAVPDYVYSPRSLFWPDVIFPTPPKLYWGQSIAMAISLQRVANLDPQVIVIVGSNAESRAIGLPHGQISSQQRGHGRGDNDAPIGHDGSGDVFTAMLHQECGENHFYINLGICRTAGTKAVCIHDGNHACRGTIGRGDSCVEQVF